MPLQDPEKIMSSTQSASYLATMATNDQAFPRLSLGTRAFGPFGQGSHARPQVIWAAAALGKCMKSMGLPQL